MATIPKALLKNPKVDRDLVEENYSRSPVRAIRAHCLRCSNGSKKEVEECRVITCELHHLRKRGLP